MMYNISICDDDQKFSEYLARKITTFFESIHTPFCIHIFNNGVQQLSCTTKLDLCFIDIYMPEMNGNELASHIRKIADSNTCAIIFVSSIHDAVYDTLKYAPLRFLRKELIDDELTDALAAFYSWKQKQSVSAALSLSENGTRFSIPISDIIRIEVSGHYLDFFSQNKTYHIRGKLSEYEKKLSSHHFCRVHQGCIINLAFVSSFNNNYITLKNGFVIRLTRTYKDCFQTAYLNWERDCLHVLTV